FGPRNLTARLKLTAEDGFGLPGVPATATATIENDKAPTVRFLSPIGFPAKPIAGRIPFTVAVTDPEVALDPLGNGRADLFVEFSTDGGTSFKAASILTIGSGARDAGQPTHGRPVGPPGDLETGKTTLLWDSVADVPPTGDGPEGAF